VRIGLTPAVVGACALLCAAASASAQARRVYVSVDMEGISGVSGEDQVNPGAGEYGRSRKLMAEDLNAAVRGALEGGAPPTSWSTTPTAPSATCCPRTCTLPPASSATASSATA
jgi:hypothetical protein